MNKEHIEVGNYFVGGFLNGAFDMEDIIPQIEYKLIEFIPKFINNEENEKFITVRNEIILVVNRTIRLLAQKTIEKQDEIFNFSIEKYLDWSTTEI